MDDMIYVITQGDSHGKSEYQRIIFLADEKKLQNEELKIKISFCEADRSHQRTIRMM